MKTKALFILKSQNEYGYGGFYKAAGLRNSAEFVSEMLNDNGIESKVVAVVDNNSIDFEVSNFKPTHVFIEALWVVPEKFIILKKLHPEVTWVVRIHSEAPFLALEGIAVDWIRRYAHEGVTVASNSLRGREEIDAFSKALYLPNFYPVDFAGPKKFNVFNPTINVGCFGAIRPLKNHLMQALAARQFAANAGLNLLFHVNTGRIEGGSPVLKNLRALLGSSLVEHKWLSHQEFLQLLRRRIDLSMSVSFTETFSIVAADAVSQGVPIVVSKEIEWADKNVQASPTDLNDIIGKMGAAFDKRETVRNQKNLKRYSFQSEVIWLEYFEQRASSFWDKLVSRFRF